MTTCSHGAAIAGTAAAVTVLVVDEEPVVRAGLRALLDEAGDIAVVGEAGDGAEAVSAARALGPDVVLLDLGLSGRTGIDGFDTTARLARGVPAPHVLVLAPRATGGGDGGGDAVLRALEAGAAGFVLKASGPGELAAAVRAVASGAGVLSRPVLRRLAARSAARRAVATGERVRRVDELGESELRVLALVGSGMSNREIGEALHLSVTSVKTYVSRILRRLELGNRTQAAILAHELGLAVAR
ncbi:response regulator transcription factor [Streptomyces sp. NPDC050095]|uniref:response regulator transcription factor n=1 Tax=unclassified Streptomyces TaxID=2593676 RepID=UPI00343EE699